MDGLRGGARTWDPGRALEDAVRRWFGAGLLFLVALSCAACDAGGTGLPGADVSLDSGLAGGDMARDGSAADVAPGADVGPGPADAAPGADTENGGGSGPPPPVDTGVAIVDRLGNAAAGCGVLGRWTVPADWDMVWVGARGCTVHAPPTWTITGEGEGTTVGFRDGTGAEGFLGMMGEVEGAVGCTPAGVAGLVLDGFTANGYAAPEIAWQEVAAVPFGGSLWDVAATVFTTGAGGVAVVGYLWDLVTPSGPFCFVSGMGFWLPESAIEAEACTLVQIHESLKCPHAGGGCDDAECDASCKGDGDAGGFCDPNSGECTCY